MFLRHLSSIYRSEVILSGTFDSEHTSYIIANLDPGGKNRGLYCGKYPLMVVSPVSFNWKLRVITLRFISENGYYT